MSKIVDITDKLNFDEKPKLKIRDKEIEVNDRAITMLKVLPKFENPTNNDLLDIFKLMFDKKSQKEIEEMNLNFNDFAQVIASAIELVSGSTDDEGETATPVTT